MGKSLLLLLNQQDSLAIAAPIAMSFHWNLSSDEEEETQEWQGKLYTPDNTKPTSLREITRGTEDVADGLSGVARKSQAIMNEFYFSEEEEEEEIEWEDANDVADEDTKPAANASLVPVTIDMNRPPERQETRKRKRVVRRRVYRFHSLPSDLQSLLLHIQQCHLLALTSRAVQLSRCCSDWELLHVAHSLMPLGENSSETPTEADVREFASWYFDLVNRTAERRRRAYADNVAAGAPVMKRGRGRQQTVKGTSTDMGVTRPDRLFLVSSYLSSTNDEHPQLSDEIELSNQDKTQLLVAMVRSKGWRARYVTVLDPVGFDLNVDHPLFMMNMGNVFRVLSKRSNNSENETTSLKKANKMSTSFEVGHDSQGPGRELGWVEILCKISPAKTQKSKPRQYRWMHVDPGNSLVDQPGAVETLFETISDCETQKRKRIIAFALAVEHVDANNDNVANEEDESNQVRLTDVTPRYTNSWSRSLQLRSAKRRRSESVSDNTWWTETLKTINSFYHSRTNSPATLQTSGTSHLEAIELRDSSDEDRLDKNGPLHPNEAIDLDEKDELLGSAANEAIPRSKAAFNNHPIYAIPSVLNVNEVLAPDAKSRICGIFKGEPVYRRSDVHTALLAKKWLYQGRKVREDEMDKPVKRVKARKKAGSNGFQPLRSYGVGEGNDGSEEARQRQLTKGARLEQEDDGMDDLYGHWQTIPWSPLPVTPNDPIPVNEYNNIELELLNPGLEHLMEPRMSKVAKQLGIPYAPCLLGFEAHGGYLTPSVRGIVVHEHNAAILREAHAEFMSGALEQEYEERKTRVLKRWKNLIVGLLTKERLEREYG